MSALDDPLERYLKDADVLAQNVITDWALHRQAGSVTSLSFGFLEIVEQACRYQEAKRIAEFYRALNGLSQKGAQAEKMARRSFIRAYKRWWKNRSAE